MGPIYEQNVLRSNGETFAELAGLNGTGIVSWSVDLQPGHQPVLNTAR